MNLQFQDLPGPPPFRIAYVDEGPRLPTHSAGTPQREGREPSRDGPALLFLHGWASTHEQWGASVARLSQRWRCVAVDLPSYGRSDVPVTDYTPAFFAESARQLLDAVGVSQAIPVGSSMGGMVAMEFALLWPERVPALVLVDAGGMWPPRPRAARAANSNFAFGIYKLVEPLVGRTMMRRAFHERGPGFDEMRARADRLHGDPKERARRRTRFNTMMHLAATSYRERAAQIRAPTLVVWGREDRLMPLSLGQRLARTVPGARLEVIEKCGHLPSVEKPEEFNRLVEEFLSSLQTRR